MPCSMKGNFEAAVTTYREALKKTLIGEENSETTAMLYVQFSRLKYMVSYVLAHNMSRFRTHII